MTSTCSWDSLCITELTLFPVLDYCGDDCVLYQTNPLAIGRPGVGRALLFMMMQTLIYGLIIIMIESSFFHRMHQKLCGTPTAGGSPSNNQVSIYTYILVKLQFSLFYLPTFNSTMQCKEVENIEGYAQCILLSSFWEHFVNLSIDFSLSKFLFRWF